MRINNNFIGASRTRDVRFGFAGNAGNDSAAIGLGQFNRRDANTASPAKDKDIVPSLHMSTIL